MKRLFIGTHTMADAQSKISSALYNKIVLHEDLTEHEVTYIMDRPVFSFDTVYHSAYLPYINGSGCTCAYRHEYFSHIDNCGNVNHQKLDALCSWLDANECPHVSMANADHHSIVTTSVNALQVAVAANNKTVYRLFQWLIHSEPGSIFCLTSMQTAILKQRYSFIEFARTLFSGRSWVLLSQSTFLNLTEIIDDEDGNNAIMMKETDAGRFCVEQNDVQLLRCVFTNTPSSQRAMEEAMFADIDDMAHELMHGSIQAIEYPILQRYILTSVLRDNPKVYTDAAFLDLFSGEVRYSQRHSFNARDLALLLGHDKCANFLKDFLVPVANTSALNPYQIVLDLMRNIDEPSHCIDLLRKLHYLGYDINKRYEDDDKTALMAFHDTKILLDTDAPVKIINPKIFAELLALGSDINLKDRTGQTVLLEYLMLETDLQDADRIDILKLCMYHNATIERQREELYADLALSFDRGMCIGESVTQCPRYPRVTFQLNALEISDIDLAVPLLWECGLDFSENIALQLNIPEMIRKYIVEKRSQPRSLRMVCRNKLRKLFPGRRLHEFVQRIRYPSQLKEYILMKHLLLNNVDWVLS